MESTIGVWNTVSRHYTAKVMHTTHIWIWVCWVVSNLRYMGHKRFSRLNKRLWVFSSLFFVLLLLFLIFNQIVNLENKININVLLLFKVPWLRILLQLESSKGRQSPKSYFSKLILKLHLV